MIFWNRINVFPDTLPEILKRIEKEVPADKIGETLTVLRSDFVWCTGKEAEFLEALYNNVQGRKHVKPRATRQK